MDSQESEIIQEQDRQCKFTHDAAKGAVPYFSKAEAFMQQQWDSLIWPRIQHFDFSKTLDLAAGHGRNSNFLRRYASEIHLVDVNQSCIDACKQRFGESDSQCRFFYYVNDGTSLKIIPDNSMTCIFSWDAMVHFDKLVCRLYILEFARVLVPGGQAFFHHSNYGHIAPDNDWQKHPHWRSNTTKELVADYLQEAGLENLFQCLIDWEIKDLDCITICGKRAAGNG